MSAKNLLPRLRSGSLDHPEIPEGYIPVRRAFLEHVNLLKAIAADPDKKADPDSFLPTMLEMIAVRDILQDFGVALPANIFSRDGTRIWLQPQDWDPAGYPHSLILSDVIINETSGPVAKYQGRTPVFAKEQFRAWQLRKAKNQLIDDLADGLTDPVEAMERASAHGIELVKKPDPAKFDVMNMAYWTVPMALAWIVWRDAEQTLMACNEFREQNESLRKVEEYIPRGSDKPRTVWLHERQSKESIDSLANRDSSRRDSVTKAWVSLRNVLSTSPELLTNGRPEILKSAEAIPSTAWIAMHEVDRTNSPYWAEPYYSNHPKKWYEVRVLREFVIWKFPVSGQPSILHEAETVEKPELSFALQKSNINAAPGETVAVKEKRSQTNRRTPAIDAARAAIKDLWPSGSIPPITSKARDNQIIKWCNDRRINTSPNSIRAALKLK